MILLLIRKKLVDRLVKRSSVFKTLREAANFIQRHCCGWGALPNKQSISLTIKFQMFRLSTK